MYNKRKNQFYVNTCKKSSKFLCFEENYQNIYFLFCDPKIESEKQKKSSELEKRNLAQFFKCIYEKYGIFRKKIGKNTNFLKYVFT